MKDLPPADLPAWRHTKRHQRAVQAALINRRQTGHILRELKAERARQDARWGQQDHPDVSAGARAEVMRSAADQARRLADYHAKNGTLAWDHILMEEVREARAEAAAGNELHLRAELIQVMAVAAAWVEALDRRMSVFYAMQRAYEDRQEDQNAHVVEALRTGHPDEDDAGVTYHGPDDVCSEGEIHRSACVKIPGLDNPPVYVKAEAVEDWGRRAPRFAREEIDVSDPADGQRSYAQVAPSAPQPVPWAENGRALRDNRVDASAVEPDEAHRLRSNGFDVGPVGAAGQPVSSYSGGGVRDVTEGKPRIDLMWPLGVPFGEQMLTRVGLWLERGMRKYAERNWERFHTADALTHALASLGRHYGEYMTNEATREACDVCRVEDEVGNVGHDPQPGCTCHEDHAAAIITNVIFAETIRWKIANNWTPEGTFGS